MSKPETWVQTYRNQIAPGPDGSPVNVKSYSFPSEIGQWGGPVERITIWDRFGARIHRRWVRVR